MCLAVTFHLHVWQNGRDLLRATAVTHGWSGYANKSQQRKLTLEKKIFLPRLEPVAFRSRVRHFTTDKYRPRQTHGMAGATPIDGV